MLVRWETTPDDIHGMIGAQGILTAHGGMTSHAAVVARGMGKPCVAGCDGLQLDLDNRRGTLNGREFAEGDTITIDGGTGEVILGPVDLVPPQINEDFETILGWADDLRRLRVRANADTPEDAARAREFGAQGIGLCRTEHMFMAEDRLPVVREMIMAADEDGRRSALERLLPMQQSDFEGIFEAMAGLPVTIRLLDPPLHEFLPSLEEATDERMRERIRALQEANPMLGTRGCRLGLQWPEIYEMQVRAIVRAARAVEERTGDAPLVEIMHPLVGFAEELKRLRELTIRTAEEEDAGEYLVGTMIELPRACVRADEIAEHADFFSFGTNDLTQTALGLLARRRRGQVPHLLPRGRRAEGEPVRDARPERGGRPDADRRRARSRREGRPQARHLRRARRRAEERRVLPRARARVRLLLAVPRAAGPPGRGAGRAEGHRRRSSRRRRVTPAPFKPAPAMEGAPPVDPTLGRSREIPGARDVARNTLETLLFRGLSTPVALLLVVVQSRFLAPSGRGQFVLVVLSVTILSRLLGQLGLAVTNRLQDAGTEVRPLVHRAFVIGALLGALGMAAIVGVGRRHTGIGAGTAAIAAAALVPNVVWQTVSGVLLGLARVRLWNYIQALSPLLTLAGMLVLVVGLDGGVQSAVFAWTLAHFLTATFALVAARDLVAPGRRAAVSRRARPDDPAPRARDGRGAGREPDRLPHRALPARVLRRRRRGRRLLDRDAGGRGAVVDSGGDRDRHHRARRARGGA